MRELAIAWSSRQLKLSSNLPLPPQRFYVIGVRRKQALIIEASMGNVLTLTQKCGLWYKQVFLLFAQHYPRKQMVNEQYEH